MQPAFDGETAPKLIREGKGVEVLNLLKCLNDQLMMRHSRACGTP